MFYDISRAVLRKVIKTPVDDIRRKLIKWDTECEDTMVYYRMQTKVLRELYAENLVLRKHGDTGFAGWEPEPELGETYENVESTWKYEDFDDEDIYDEDVYVEDGWEVDEFWIEDGWEELHMYNIEEGQEIKYVFGMVSRQYNSDVSDDI